VPADLTAEQRAAQQAGWNYWASKVVGLSDRIKAVEKQRDELDAAHTETARVLRGIVRDRFGPDFTNPEVGGSLAVCADMDAAELAVWLAAELNEPDSSSAVGEQTHAPPDTPGEADADCDSCGEGEPLNECPRSKRPCGHHCNHIWSHDCCHWCATEYDENGDLVPAAGADTKEAPGA